MEDYCNVFEKNLPSLMNINGKINRGFLFKKDNAPIHTAFVSRDWLGFSFIRDTNWHTRSSDLNSIEIVCGAMFRDVNRKKRQFYSVSEVQWAMLKTWDNINPQLYSTLILSMPKRCIDVLKNFSGKTSY